MANTTVRKTGGEFVENSTISSTSSHSSAAKPPNITFRNLSNHQSTLENVIKDSLQPLWRLWRRGQGVGAIPFQPRLGLRLHQPSLEVGVQLRSQLLQGHGVLVLVGTLQINKLQNDKLSIFVHLGIVTILDTQIETNLIIKVFTL